MEASLLLSRITSSSSGLTFATTSITPLPWSVSWVRRSGYSPDSLWPIERELSSEITLDPISHSIGTTSETCRSGAGERLRQHRLEELRHQVLGAQPLDRAVASEPLVCVGELAAHDRRLSR